MNRKFQNRKFNLFVIFRYTAFLAISPRHRQQPAQTGTGTDLFSRHRTGTSLGSVCAGAYRVPNGLSRCLTIDIDRYRPLETRYEPTQTDLDWCRCKQVGAVWVIASRCWLVPVDAVAGTTWPRCRGEIARNAVIEKNEILVS